MKLTTRCGPAAVEGLNEVLLAKAAEAKVLRTSRVRADTTVVPANACYPTDSGLLAKAIRRISTAGQPRRSQNLDRTRDLHPQPNQDRRSHRLKPITGPQQPPSGMTIRHPLSHHQDDQGFSGRSRLDRAVDHLAVTDLDEDRVMNTTG